MTSTPEVDTTTAITLKYVILPEDQEKAVRKLFDEDAPALTERIVQEARSIFQRDKSKPAIYVDIVATLTIPNRPALIRSAER